MYVYVLCGIFFYVFVQFPLSPSMRDHKHISVIHIVLIENCTLFQRMRQHDVCSFRKLENQNQLHLGRFTKKFVLESFGSVN